MPSQERIRTFVVDDHQVVRMGLKTMLESVSDIELAGLAANAADALAALEQTQADVLLTDLHIGEMGGDGLIKEVLLRHPAMHCAVLTNYHSDEDVFRAIKAGALAYILKSAPLEQVTEAIRHVHAGKTALPPYIADQLARRLSRNPLSGRETQILQYVAEGLTNLEIAKKLCISKNTVRNHVINILEKLGTRDRTEAIAVAIRRGLVRINED